MRLVFVENEADRLKHIREACLTRDVELLGDGIFPFPVNARSYSNWIKAVRAYSGELILVLDLDLEVQKTLEEQCRELSIDADELATIQSNHGRQYWQGFLLAREAIKNEDIRPLVVAIASTVDSPQAKIRFLESYVAACLNQSVRIFQVGEAIESGEAANRCLDLVVQEYATAFPLATRDLSSVDWRGLRLRALDLCSKKAPSLERGDVHWAHHAPHGEHAYGEIPNIVTAAVESVRTELSAVFPQVKQLPFYSWSKLKERVTAPIRAILTFESGSADLSAAVYAINATVSHHVRSEVDVFVTVGPDIGRATRLRHDYLWFNVIAVGQGLSKLADGFSHVVAEKRKGLSAETECRGEFTAAFVELESGMRVDVLQRIVCWHASRGADGGSCIKERFLIEAKGLPVPETAKRIVSQAYEDLRNAGANIVVDHIGRLQAEISAEAMSLPIGIGQVWIVRGESE